MSLLGPFSAQLHGKIIQQRTAQSTHAGDTSAHGATSAATASRIILRDASGRAQVATPTAAGEIANKSYVDNAISASPSGTVTQILTGTGLTGGPITAAGTISLAASGVNPGSYAFATVVVDAQGRVTSASAGAPVIQVTANSAAGLYAQGTQQNPFINMQAATSGQNGFMSAAYAAKLDGIQAGAQVNVVASVFGRGGNVGAQFGDYSTTHINGLTVSNAGPSGGFDGALWFQVP